LRNNGQRTTHNIKQLGFSDLQGFGSRFNIFVVDGNAAENPTVSYCQSFYATCKKTPDTALTADN
jgi:pyruvate dehydrogenase complex dehydrogenase (E1) component